MCSTLYLLMFVYRCIGDEVQQFSLRLYGKLRYIELSLLC